MPGTLEAYYQEAGRAGRDGLPSECVLLHAFSDRFTHEFFIKTAHPDRAIVERVYNEIVRAADGNGLARVEAEDISPAVARTAQGAGSGICSSHSHAIRIGGERARERDAALRAPARDAASHQVGARRGIRGGARAAAARSGAWAARAATMGSPSTRTAFAPGLGGAFGIPALLDALQDRQFIVWERSGGGLRVPDVRRPFSALRINWEQLDRRRAGDMGKLEAMQKYAYTTACRRGFLLRYFGDPAASNACTGCDICLGTHDRSAPAPKAAGPRKRRGVAGGASAGALAHGAPRAHGSCAKRDRRERCAAGAGRCSARAPHDTRTRGEGSRIRDFSRPHPGRDGSATSGVARRARVACAA